MESREVVPKVEDGSNNVHSEYSSHKYLLRYLPEDERLRRYMEARKRIFAENQLSGMRLVSRRVQKARERFRMRRSRRREVVAAVKRIDPRPFANVETLGKQLTGLLDTDASVSVLGKGCRELVEALGVQSHFSVVRTASGDNRSIIGRLKLPAKYKGVSKPVTFYLFPYMEQTAYFGVDFWRAFGLAPAVVGKPVTRGVNAAEEIHASQMEHCADQEDEDEVREEPESWSLSAEEKLALGKVKE